MKKKIRDLTVKDVPNCWLRLFAMDNALIILLTEDEEEFNIAKDSIPDEVLDQEVEVEE